MTYNCIIIDDEQPARKLIENHCSKLDFLNVIGSFKSPILAMDILSGNTIDILFLDIQMPDINGLDFIKSMQNRSINVILTTAYREFALDGYNLNAVDYLLKPIEFSRFFQAIEKINTIHSKSNVLSTSFIHIKSNKKQYKLAIEDIIYLKSESEYIVYYTKSHGKLMVYGALKDAQKTLNSSAIFCRVHRSYIINLNEIAFVEGQMIMILDRLIPISESYKEQFYKKWSS